MLRRAAEEVDPKECLPDLLYLNVVVRRALFSDDPEPSGFDSFFGSLSRRNEMDDGRQRKNGKLKKIIINHQTPIQKSHYISSQIMTLGFAKDEFNFLHFIMEIEFIFCLIIRFTFFY